MHKILKKYHYLSLLKTNIPIPFLGGTSPIYNNAFNLPPKKPKIPRKKIYKIKTKLFFINNKKKTRKLFIQPTYLTFAVYVIQ